MISRYTHGDLVWIDLESPTRDEVCDLIEEFDIDLVVAEELLLPSTKGRVELHPNFAYLVFHFPALRHTHTGTGQEVDFIVGKKFIITTRYETIDPLHTFSKAFEVNSVLDTSMISQHAGFIFFYMLKKLYDAVDDEIAYIRAELQEIESEIFQGHEKAMVVTLSNTARNLMGLRQTIEPHRDILRSLEFEGKTIWGEPFLPYLRMLTSQYYRVHNHIMRHGELLREMRDTNDSLLNAKQNETMKVLTVIAFIMLPLSFIAGLFGMNSDNMPIIGHPLDFWLISAVMVVIAILLIGYFKHKEWL